MTRQSKTERFIYHVLFLEPPAKSPEKPPDTAVSAERAFGFSLLFSGVRCVLQYVVLPFILPLVGLTTDAAVPVTLAINLVALLSILYSVRRFWQIDYKHKWQYLPIAVTAVIMLSAFIVLDLQALLV